MNKKMIKKSKKTIGFFTATLMILTVFIPGGICVSETSRNELHKTDLKNDYMSLKPVEIIPIAQERVVYIFLATWDPESGAQYFADEEWAKDFGLFDETLQFDDWPVAQQTSEILSNKLVGSGSSLAGGYECDDSTAESNSASSFNVTFNLIDSWTMVKVNGRVSIEIDDTPLCTARLRLKDSQQTIFEYKVEDAFYDEILIDHNCYLPAGDYTLLAQALSYGYGFSCDPTFKTATFEFDFEVFEPVAGDVTGDGIVDVNDLLAILAVWDQTGERPGWILEDIVHDGIVDTLDLLEVLAHWS